MNEKESYEFVMQICIKFLPFSFHQNIALYYELFLSLTLFIFYFFIFAFIFFTKRDFRD